MLQTGSNSTGDTDPLLLLTARPFPRSRSHPGARDREEKGEEEGKGEGKGVGGSWRGRKGWVAGRWRRRKERRGGESKAKAIARFGSTETESNPKRAGKILIGHHLKGKRCNPKGVVEGSREK